MRIIPLVLALSLAYPVAAQDVTQGEALFGFYCATCHGTSAIGNGPM
jgi:mono/diheme cytochrome c family protein